MIKEEDTGDNKKVAGAAPLTREQLEQLKEKEIMVEDFVKLFEKKDYEGRIMACLNLEIRIKREEALQLQKQRDLMKQLRQSQEKDVQLDANNYKSSPRRESVLSKSGGAFVFEFNKNQIAKDKEI